MSAQSKTLAPIPSVAAGAPPARLAVIGAFLATYLIWGSTYLAIWYAVATIPPLYTAGFRHAMSGSILLAAAWLKGQRPTWRQFKASVVIGLLR